MSVYNSWYISKAKKFNATAKKSEKGTILLDLETYDGLKIDATPDQWAAILAAVSPFLQGKGAPPQRKATDDDVEY